MKMQIKETICDAKNVLLEDLLAHRLLTSSSDQLVYGEQP